MTYNAQFSFRGPAGTSLRSTAQKHLSLSVYFNQPFRCSLLRGTNSEPVSQRTKNLTNQKALGVSALPSFYRPVSLSYQVYLSAAGGGLYRDFPIRQRCFQRFLRFFGPLRFADFSPEPVWPIETRRARRSALPIGVANSSEEL